MSKIHYFQRYSTFENAATNNTLLLLSRIYQYAPSKLSILLSRLIDEDNPIEIGVEILQQERGLGSIPDGKIIQRSFKILIEAKVDSIPSLDQLLRHAESFSNESRKMLLLLTKTPIGTMAKEIEAALAESQPDVDFSSVTFGDINKALEGLFREHEYEMRDLVEDYEDYCITSGLVDQSPYLMRVVPCGKSLDINRKHGIYFQPADRGYRLHQFVGIYRNKAVQALWELDSVYDVEYNGKTLNKALRQGRDTSEYDRRIKAIILDARTECGYEISTGHRFFCGEPFDTHYVKQSSGGMQGARFVDLRGVIGEFDGAADAAARLNGMTWS